MLGCLISSSHSQTWKSKNQKALTTKDRLTALEDKVDRLEGRIEKPLWVAAILFLYASVAAIWAQHTGRNARKWFVLGVFFNVLIMVVIMIINMRDKDREKAELLSLQQKEKKADGA